MPRDSNGWGRLKDLLARMRTQRKTLDDDIRKEIKDYANQKWVFFALYDDTFEIRDRDRAGGDDGRRIRGGVHHGDRCGAFERRRRTDRRARRRLTRESVDD